VYRDGIPCLPCGFDKDGTFREWTDAEWELYLEACRKYNIETAEPEKERAGCR
jgi:hypothetical protein